MQVDFLIILFVIAGLYASVGHGGASGYLALMAIYQFAPTVMKPTALILNLFVAGISFIQFSRKGHFRLGLFWPFAIASVPAAFIGGMFSLDPLWYKRILGVLLVFAVLRLLGLFGKTETKSANVHLGLALMVGGAIGFLSGLIGIGGGIILSPLVLLMGWGDVKETAAVSALFIWVNSLAGLLGLVSAGQEMSLDMWPYIIIAIGGGLIGSYFGSFKWNYQVLRYCLSFVLALASFKLIFL